jgi:hypothetical protein
MTAAPPDWEAVERSASILKMRVVVQSNDQLPDMAIAEARQRTTVTGRLHVAVVRVSKRASRRLVCIDTEPLATTGRLEAAEPLDPFGLRTLSFASGFRCGGDFAVINLDRLLAARADPDAPAWHRSVWAEIIAPSRQALAVAAASIAAVETENSTLAARVATGLLVDRGLTEDEAGRADPNDGALGEHLARLGLRADDLVGVGRSAMGQRTRRH